MISRLVLRVFVSLFVLSSSAVWAQIGGTTAYPFLNVTSSPRPAGLAQASLASVDGDIQYAWINPALLRDEHENQIGLSYLSLPGGLNAAEASYGFGWKERGTVMAGFRYFDYGTFQGTDITGTPTGEFRASDQLLQLGYSYFLDSNWQFGLSTKLINSVYETYSSFGVAFDVSALYQIPRSRFAFALIARNAGVQLTTYAGERDPLPFELAFAVSNRFEHLPFRWTVQIENLQRWDLTYFDPNGVARDPITGEETYDEPGFGDMLLRHFSVSGELILGKRINLQLGYSFRHAAEMRVATRRSSAGLTFGLGLKLSKFQINYANRIVHVAGRMHHIGLMFDLEDFGS